MPKSEYTGSQVAKGYKIGVVISRFNELISGKLLSGALDELERHSAEECEVLIFWVPGSFEIPQTTARLLEKGGFDGVLALGCLIEGETDHYRILAGEVAKGLAQLSIKHTVPVGFGILTTHSLEEALDRAGAKAGNKGAEAMVSLLEMIDLYKKLKVT